MPTSFSLLIALGMFTATTHADPPSDRAQSSTPLHRRLPASTDGARITPVFIYDPVKGGSMPREVELNGDRREAPGLKSGPTSEDLIYAMSGLQTLEGPKELPPTAPDEMGEGKPSAGGHTHGIDPRTRNGTRARPDRKTHREGTLQYHTTFDPALVPFKRNRALDVVRKDLTLEVSSNHLSPLDPIGNRVEANREIFWGSVMIQGKSGDTIPIPSASPDSRILSFQTHPPVDVSFFKDVADNYYVRPADDESFQLLFLMDAPSAYFGHPISPNARLGDVPQSLRPRVDRKIAHDARHVARTVGIKTQRSYRSIINGLVRYFRSFEPGEVEENAANIYLDLALGRRGICRHRTFAFVTTAQGLGIPARYVFNEAHVFAEVWLPDTPSRWLRVDLGGDAERLVIHQGERKSMHQPRGRDPFDTPPGFADQQTRGATAGAMEVLGLPGDQSEPSPRPGRDRFAPRADAVTTLLGDGLDQLNTGGGQHSTVTTMTIETPLLFRGEVVSCSGKVSGIRGGHPTTGVVHILLREMITKKPTALLAVTNISPSGSFETTFTLPATLSTGNYDMVAVYRGDDVFAPSSSE